MQAGLSVIGTLAITGNLTVSGRVTMPGYMFAAGVVSATGTKTTGTGQVAWTVARSAGQATGVYTITFPTAHPLGSNYIVTVSDCDRGRDYEFSKRRQLCTYINNISSCFISACNYNVARCTLQLYGSSILKFFTICILL